MWQVIGGLAVGMGAALLAPKVISGVASGAGLAVEEARRIGQYGYEGLAGALTAANGVAIDLLAVITGESKEEAEVQVEKAEEFVEDVAKDLAKDVVEDEAVSFIEVFLVAAI